MKAKPNLRISLAEARNDDQILRDAFRQACAVHESEKPGLLCTNSDHWWSRVYKTAEAIYAGIRLQSVVTHINTFAHPDISSYIAKRSAVNHGKKGGRSKTETPRIKWLREDMAEQRRLNPKLTAKGYFHALSKRADIVHEDGDRLYFTDEHADQIGIASEDLIITIHTIARLFTKLKQQN